MKVRKELLERIILETYLRDQFVEEYFKTFGDPFDGSIKDETHLAEAFDSMGIQLDD